MVSELKALFEYYEKEKGIDRSKMVDALQSALLAASKKSIGPARELRIEIDPDKGLFARSRACWFLTPLRTLLSSFPSSMPAN